MKLRNIVLSTLLIFGLGLSTDHAQTPPAGVLSQQGVAPQDILAVFPALSATGQTAAVSLVGTPLKPGGSNPGIQYLYTPKFGAVQATTTGSPSGCSFQVFGTLKLPSESPVYPTDYFAITGAESCTTTPEIYFITYSPVAQILVNLTTLSGGTSPTVSFRYLGVH